MISMRYTRKERPFMIATYQSADEPSQSSIQPSTHTFQLSHEERRRIQHLHLSLLSALRGVHRFMTMEGVRIVGSAAQQEAEAVRSELRIGIPDILVDMTDIPVFLTTEIVFDADRHPYIVSINAHSARHWDAIVRHTEGRALIQAIRERSVSNQLIIIKRPYGEHPYPALARALTDAGMTTTAQTMKEVADQAETYATQKDGMASKPCILELPMTQGNTPTRRLIQRNADIVLQPFTHLSSQHILALLSHPRHSAVRDALIVKYPFCITDLAELRAVIPETLPLSAKGIPRNYLIKKAGPLTTQRVRKTYGSYTAEEIAASTATSVAQRPIQPLIVLFPHERISCPFRIIATSYGGRLLDMIGVAQTPTNGHPAQNLAVNINTASL